MFISIDELGLSDDIKNIAGVKVSVCVEACDANEKPISGSIAIQVPHKILQEKIFSCIRENSDFLVGQDIKIQNISEV